MFGLVDIVRKPLLIGGLAAAMMFSSCEPDEPDPVPPVVRFFSGSVVLRDDVDLAYS